jgi:hypothetical protein
MLESDRKKNPLFRFIDTLPGGAGMELFWKVAGVCLQQCQLAETCRLFGRDTIFLDFPGLDLEDWLMGARLMKNLSNSEMDDG